jgi:hypothetical protein
MPPLWNVPSRTCPRRNKFSEISPKIMLVSVHLRFQVTQTGTDALAFECYKCMS